MQKIIAILLLSLTSIAYALPNCPYPDPSVRWHNCFGTYTSANGDKYVGEFKDGKEHGQGTYTSANGDEYVGEFKDGKEHGQGTFTFADGDKYVGEYKDVEVESIRKSGSGAEVEVYDWDTGEYRTLDMD